MGCNGDKGDALIVMSDATAAMSGATSDERVINQRRLHPPQQLQHNRRAACFRTQDRAIRQTRNCISVRRTTQCARPQTKGKGGDGSTPLAQNLLESIS
jgi:hypothetical protein